jgi:hypothetical protein
MEPTLEEIVKSLSQTVVYLLDELRNTRKTISNGFKKIDENFIEIHTKIDALSADTGSNFVNVDLNLKSIKDEILKINKVTGYKEKIENFEKIVKGGKW